MLSAHTDDEAGFTLVEVLVALSILGIAVTALLGGLGLTVQTSDIHRKQATSETLLRQAVENVKAAGYSPCHPAGAVEPDPYTVGTVPVPTGYDAVRIQSVAVWRSDTNAWDVVWNGSTWAGTCGAAYNDPALQRITVEAKSLDGRAIEKVDIVKRNAFA
jgi:prepilin-type N-terminal cleavage/methylation domain-containing protein